MADPKSQGNSGKAPGNSNKPPTPPGLSKKDKYRKTYTIGIWITSGAGTYDSNLLTEFEQTFQVGPPPYWSEGSVNVFIDDIAKNGYTFKSESGALTKYPSHRIDKIEAVEVD